MLLLVGRHEFVEAELHHRNMQQISGLYGNGLTEFLGKRQGRIEDLVIINFKVNPLPLFRLRAIVRFGVDLVAALVSASFPDSHSRKAGGR